MSEAAAGPTATILKGPVGDRESLGWRTRSSLTFFAPCRLMVAALLYTRAQLPTSNTGREILDSLDKVEVSVFDTRQRKRVVLTNQTASMALAVDGEVAVSELIPVQTLVATHVGGVAKGMGEGVEAITN